MQIQRAVVVPRPLEQVFGYLSDFTRTVEWDPATIESVRLSGDGREGTRYRNTIVFSGRHTDIDYVVTHWVENKLFVLRGENHVLRTLKRFTLRDVSVDADHPHATRVTFTGDYDFSGATRYVAPLLTRAMDSLVTAGEHGMESALLRL